ncbi:MAG: MBL fold metallo-hydrolase [bacterium]
MDVHHLNCCPMHPFGKRFINGEGSYLEPAELVTHCLLLDVSGGLILVDTGLGRLDLHDPSRLGTLVNLTMNPSRSPDPTAYTRISNLGYDPAEVKHIFVTHLDMDHVGGLADFPEASIHLLEEEYQAAQDPPLMERLRYRQQLWEHNPNWTPYSSRGEDWFGFPSLQPLPDEVPELRMVPLPGHSAGHCGIAVKQNDGWLLHCGDAYFDANEMSPDDPSCTPGLRLQQKMISHDNRVRIETQNKLRDLIKHSEVDTVCSHSPEEYREFSSR